MHELEVRGKAREKCSDFAVATARKKDELVLEAGREEEQGK